MSIVGGTQITEPGVYSLIPEVYHRDPVPDGSLSSSGARKLLPPSCPALFNQWIHEGQPPKRTFEFGHAAHREVLGAGETVVVIDADDYRTKDARNQRDTAYADGKIPLLPHEYDIVLEMAEAIRTHPVASALFDPDGGQPEQALFWVDKETGIWRRAMLDWLPNRVEGQRLVVPDYKTVRSAEPRALSRAMYDYGYAQQADWYSDGVKALGLAGDLEPAFVLVAQEKTPPYLVTVAQPDPEALLWGHRLNGEAIATYRHCTDTGRWPGYSDEVVSLELPVFAIHQLEDAWERGTLSAHTEDAA